MAVDWNQQAAHDKPYAHIIAKAWVDDDSFKPGCNGNRPQY